MEQKRNQLTIKAGNCAYEIIKYGGFSCDSISTYFGSAIGSRWLISSGFDFMMLTHGLLGHLRSVHLIGSSAGAWSFTARVQPDAVNCYQKFLEAYIDIAITKTDTPWTVQDKGKDLINLYLENDALPFALANKKYSLVVITSRELNLVDSQRSWLQKTGLLAGNIMNFFSRSNVYQFAERVVLYQGSKPPAFCFQSCFCGSFVNINEINLKVPFWPAGRLRLLYPKSVIFTTHRMEVIGTAA